jgi:hypothetical protein
MVGGIFCDVQKAFDSVNHNILTNKIRVLSNNRNNLQTT